MKISGSKPLDWYIILQPNKYDNIYNSEYEINNNKLESLYLMKKGFQTQNKKIFEDGEKMYEEFIKKNENIKNTFVNNLKKKTDIKEKIFEVKKNIYIQTLNKKSIKELNTKYKEVSKLLFFIGALLYSGIFLGISDLFSMLPTHESLMASVPVILILGFNVLINMGTGFNGEIITYSKYYKFNIIAIAILVVLNVSLNLLFLAYFKMGIESVALASLISLVGFNLAKLVFIYKKFELLPFDKSYLKLVVIVAVSLLIANFLPKFESVLANLIFKIGVCFLLNLSIIYKLKLVYQYNFWVDKILKRH